MRTTSRRSPASVIRTITERRRCRSIPTYCRPSYCSLTGASFVVLTVSTPSIRWNPRGAEAPLLHRIRGPFRCPPNIIVLLFTGAREAGVALEAVQDFSGYADH